jgi:hypothetical protein
LAKTVFFTVTENERSQKSQKILERLSRLPGVIKVELAHFDPVQDAEEVKDYVALIDHNARTEFPREWMVIGPNAPGIPEWARYAKARALIGTKAVASPDRELHCAQSIWRHFPVGFLAPEKGGESFLRYGKVK